MTAATQDAMVAALVDDAIRREIETNGRITSVARFKTSVRESILDGERCHPGYIALCWTELAKRRAAGQEKPKRRPAPAPIDDEPYTPAGDYQAHRWNRLCTALSRLGADHPLTTAALDVAHSIRARDEARGGRTITELERGQDDHNAQRALDALEQLAIDTGVNLDQPGRPTFIGTPEPRPTPAARRKQRSQLTAVPDPTP